MRASGKVKVPSWMLSVCIELSVRGGKYVGSITEESASFIGLPEGISATFCTLEPDQVLVAPGWVHASIEALYCIHGFCRTTLCILTVITIGCSGGCVGKRSPLIVSSLTSVTPVPHILLDLAKPRSRRSEPEEPTTVNGSLRSRRN